MTDEKPLGLGLIGCGSFGLFCMETFAHIEGIRPVAAADAHKPAADRFAERFPGVAVHYSAAELIDRDDVGLVHVATPPGTHHALALRAARAGKHVLCEKPLAMTLAQADEMLMAAAQHHVIMPVNFVLRYNPVTDAVKAVIDSGLLGRPLHAALANNAADENLPPGHWFWDKAASGGIFIEHGVHFFDLYRHWFGPGRVVCAHTEVREHTAQEDRVMCTVRHDDGTVVSHYHGFDQTGRMDRTEHRLVFELGDVTVRGWIPTEMSVHALVDDQTLPALEELCAPLHPALEVLETYDGDRRTCRSRGRERTVTQKVRLSCTAPMDKQRLYAWSVGRLMSDQVAGIRDPHHARRVTEADGREALALAVAAADAAGHARRRHPPSEA